MANEKEEGIAANKAATAEGEVPAKKKPSKQRKDANPQTAEAEPAYATEPTDDGLKGEIDADAPKVKAEMSFPTGKVPQKKRNVTTCNPDSKQYDPKIAKRRAKEKLRRQTNKKLRRMGRK